MRSLRRLGGAGLTLLSIGCAALRAARKHAQQHSIPIVQTHIAASDGEGDCALRIFPARVRDLDLVNAVNAAGIGGENPHGLELVLAADGTVAAAFRIGAETHKHAIVYAAADLLAVPVEHGAAVAVADITADLATRAPVAGGGAVGSSFGNLRLLDLDVAGQGAKFGGDGDFLLLIAADEEGIEAESDESAGVGGGGREGPSCVALRSSAPRGRAPRRLRRIVYPRSQESRSGCGAGGI